MPKPSALPLNRFLAVAVICWAVNFVALRRLYDEMTPPTVSLLRFGAMFAGLLALAPWLKVSLRYPKEAIWRIATFGFLSMGLYMVLFLEGMRNTGAAEGAILLNLSPILTILISAGLGQERLRIGTLIGATTAFLGILMVIGSSVDFGPGKLFGNALVLLSALTWAYSMVLAKPLFSEYGPSRVLILSMLPGLPMLILYWAVIDRGQVPELSLSAIGWLCFAHVSLLSGVVAFLCFYRGVRDAGPAGAMLSMYFVPPLAAIAEWLSFGKALTQVQVVGLVVVLIGTTIAHRSRSGSAGSLEPAEGKT